MFELSKLGVWMEEQENSLLVQERLLINTRHGKSTENLIHLNSHENLQEQEHTVGWASWAPHHLQVFVWKHLEHLLKPVEKVPNADEE